MTNLIKELKSDLRNLSKYEVLNNSYLFNNYCFSIKATKSCIMGMQAINLETSQVIQHGGLYELTQKRIIELVISFLENL